MGLIQVVTAVAIGAALSGCAGTRTSPAAFHPVLNEAYHLDSGDKVRVTVFEQETLTNSYAIDKSGALAMPLVGTVPARGQTTKELESVIAGRLRNGYLNDPDVTVEVETYRPFFVMGEVTQGGQYSYVPGMTVQNGVAIAGGFTPRADKRTAELTRQIDGKIVTGRVPMSDPLQPGDTLLIKERWF